MAPSRILYLNPTAQMGGAEYSLLDLAGSLDRTRFLPTLACFGDGPLVRAAADRGLPLVSIPLPERLAALSLKGGRSGPLQLGTAGLAAVPLAWRVRSLASGADIVHTNGNKAHVLGAVAAGRARLVWHVRDFWRPGAFERVMVRTANARAHAVISNSGAVREHLASMGISGGLLHAIPNGIDTARFSPDGPAAPIRTEFGWAADAPVIGIVGVLARWKGQDVLLRAFSEVLRSRPDARCIVIGDEIYVTRGQTGFGADLRQLVRDLHVEHAVAFAGYRYDVPALLRALDLVVHASIEPEPFGRVVAEAMACERAVIATDGGGIPEITGPAGESALLVPRGDAAALSAAIQRLLSRPAEAAGLGRAGRRRILAGLALERHVERMQALYDGLLTSRRAAIRAAAGSPL